MIGSRHKYTARIGSVVLPISEGRITLDAGRAPHVAATIAIPVDYVDLIDPRDTPRVVLKVSARFPNGVQERTFDLGVRARPTNHANGTITIRLASDERLLDDYRPLADDTTPLGLAASLRAVISYVLDKADVGTLVSTIDANVTPTPGGAEVEALTWRAGKSALEFLRPLVQAKGLRLVCDETRTWSLRGEGYTGHGTVHRARYGEELIDASETIDRDSGLWFDARVTRYKWTDGSGVHQERVDAYALTTPYTRATLLEIEAPYPGPGRSQYAVRRAQQRGREISVTRVSDWTVHAEQPLIVIFPDMPTQFGAIQSVEYDLSNDEMTMTARTIDTPDTAWMLLDAGETWDDSAPGESWEEEA